MGSSVNGGCTGYCGFMERRSSPQRLCGVSSKHSVNWEGTHIAVAQQVWWREELLEDGLSCISDLRFVFKVLKWRQPWSLGKNTSLSWYFVNVGLDCKAHFFYRDHVRNTLEVCKLAIHFRCVTFWTASSTIMKNKYFCGSYYRRISWSTFGFVLRSNYCY